MNEHNSTIHITSAHEESKENENIKKKKVKKKNIDCQHCDQKFSSDKIDAKSHDEHDVTDETIEKILPILEINEPDLDLNGNDSSYKLGINYVCISINREWEQTRVKKKIGGTKFRCFGK